MLFFLFENRMKFSLLCILAGGKCPWKKRNHHFSNTAAQNAGWPKCDSASGSVQKKEIQCPGRTHKSCSKPDRRLRGEMPKNPASDNSGLGAELVCS